MEGFMILLFFFFLEHWLSGKESAYQYRKFRFSSWVRKIPWRRKWQPNAVFLPGESHGQRSLVGYTLWGCRESDMTEQLSTQAWLLYNVVLISAVEQNESAASIHICPFLNFLPI